MKPTILPLALAVMIAAGCSERDSFYDFREPYPKEPPAGWCVYKSQDGLFVCLNHEQQEFMRKGYPQDQGFDTEDHAIWFAWSYWQYCRDEARKVKPPEKTWEKIRCD